jgi:uncharacterized protein YqeY
MNLKDAPIKGNESFLYSITYTEETPENYVYSTRYKIENDIDEIILSEKLSPHQEMKLEKILEVTVYDRNHLILEIFEKQGRADLAQTEREELEVLNTFLPKQMTEEELMPLIQKIISDLGVTDAKEMGKVMGAANKEFAGKADGGTISKIVKQLLAQ